MPATPPALQGPYPPIYGETVDCASLCCRIRDRPAAGGLQFLLRAKPGDGRTEVCFRRVPELFDEGMPIERLLHDAALHALAASVNQAHLMEAGGVRRGDVFGDDRRDVAWSEGVKVQDVFDGYAVSHERG